jgi:phosphotransferase system enzyme I (PtsI)
LAPPEPRTRDGVRITVLLNVSDPVEASAVGELSADGIGLYRTEFHYMGSAGWPSEDECYDTYRRIAIAVGDRELNIRLADFGAEKCPAYADIPVNRNPSLGIRGIRLLLSREDILRPQVKALERLAQQRPITVLLPMVDTLDTLSRATQKLCRICRCHGQAKLPFRLGLMVEIPSAALAIKQLMAHVDSVSIGLNDLTQYLLAADRDDELVEPYHDPLQPVVLEVVQRVIEAADAAEKPVTMCGELAGEPRLVRALLAHGARRFSVSRLNYCDTVELIQGETVAPPQAP